MGFIADLSFKFCGRIRCGLGRDCERARTDRAIVRLLQAEGFLCAELNARR